MEVRNEAYFCPFVLALVEDASGGEAITMVDRVR